MNKQIIVVFALLVALCVSQITVEPKPIMTYDYRMTIDSEQSRAIDGTTDNVSVRIQALVNIAIQKNTYNNFKAFLTYQTLDIVKYSVESTLEVNVGSTEEKDVTAFFIATVEASSGRVIELLQPEGQNDSLTNWATIDLIRQVFPDLRRYYNSNLLQQEELIEEDHLGTVEPEYNSVEWGDNAILKKSYTEEDFVDMYYDLGGQTPEVDFEQTVIIDKKSGLVKRTRQTYKINIATEIDYKLSQNENEEPIEEILGEISAEVESEAVLVDENPNPSILIDMMDYVSYTDFTPVDLENDGGKIEEFDQDQSQIETLVIDQTEHQGLQQGSPIYTYTYDIFKKSMLGQTFGIEARYNNYGQSSKVSAHVVLNNRDLLTLLQFQYQHCPGAREGNYNREFNFQLFSVSYPVLAVLSIKVTASITINYGYTWYYGGNDANTGCEVRFQPYVKPGIQATGSAHVLGIAEGGMYAQGTMTNSYLTFKAELRNAFTAQSKRLGGSVSLYIKINPFEYDIGAYYKLIKCDLKKLFRWPPKFKKICSMGSAHKISLINGKIGGGIDKTIFQWSFQI